MAEDLANLGLAVDSKDLRPANRELDNLTKKSQKAEKATKGLGRASRETKRGTEVLASSLFRLAGTVSVVALIASGLREVVSVTREFDILSAGLETATGSAQGAAQAFTAIQEFASTTPYDLQQVTDAFITLVNRGLTPSEEALTSYGDTAAALGKDLSGLINAVANATVGEFETLKTFGIKAKDQGDQISFTFRGVTTTVAKTSRDIEGYLINLGQVNFAGAMEKRMMTLDGALSNFGDSWDKLVLDVSQSGLGDAIEGSVRVGIKVLEELGYQIRSLSDEGNLSDVQRQIADTGLELLDASNMLMRLQDEGDPRKIQIFTDHIKKLEGALSDLSDRERDLRVGSGTDDALERFQAISSGDPTAINKLIEELRTAEEQVDESYRKRNETILSRRSELDGAIKEAEEQLGKETNDERRKTLETTLAQFKVERDEYAKLQEDLLARSKSAYERQKRESIRAVEEQLMSEAVAVSVAYDERQAVIDKFYANDEAKRKAMTEKNIALFDQETLQLSEATVRREFELEEARILARQQRQGLEDRLMTEAEALEFQYDLIAQAERDHQRNLDEIKTSAFLSDQERNALIEQENARHQDALRRADMVTAQLRLDTAAGIAGDLTAIAQGVFGEQSKAAKAAFAVQKALSVASSTLNMFTAISNALAVPFPANIPLIAQATSQGAALITAIKGTQLPGYQGGGWTGNGDVNKVAGVTHGQEFVVKAGPASQYRPMLEQINRGVRPSAIAGGAMIGGGVSVSIENYGTSKAFDVQQMDEGRIRIIARDEAEDIVNRKTPDIVSNQVGDPNSRVSKALSQNLQAQRRR